MLGYKVFLLNWFNVPPLEIDIKKGRAHGALFLSRIFINATLRLLAFEASGVKKFPYPVLHQKYQKYREILRIYR